MNKSVSPPLLAAVVGIALVLVLGAGWFFINREPQRVSAAPAAGRTMAGGQEPGDGSAASAPKMQQRRPDDP